MQSIRGFFKRRSFNAIALDELNTFRLLPALLRPLVLQDPRIESQADLCMAISSIPFKNRELTVSEKTKHLLFVHQYEQREGFDSSPSSYVASWKVKANPAEMISESFYAQFASPSAMISRREGTLMEHAMAFCSMLLGIGVNAYVAIGRIKKRRYIWVIVIHVKKIDEQEKRKTRYADTDEDVAVDLSQLDFVSYESAGKKYVFKKKRFALLSLVDEVNAKNSKLVVTHYDIATGKAFLFYGHRYLTNNFHQEMLSKFKRMSNFRLTDS